MHSLQTQYRLWVRLAPYFSVSSQTVYLCPGTTAGMGYHLFLGTLITFSLRPLSLSFYRTRLKCTSDSIYQRGVPPCNLWAGTSDAEKHAAVHKTASTLTSTAARQGQGWGSQARPRPRLVSHTLTFFQALKPSDFNKSDIECLLNILSCHNRNGTVYPE